MFGLWIVVGIALSLLLSSRIPAVLLTPQAVDVWFDVDLGDAFQDMTNRFSSEKSELHPFFSLAAFPPTRALVSIAGLNPWLAARLTIALGAGLWSGLVFAFLRVCRSRRLEACLFTLVGLSSATFMFLAGVPETFLFGSITVLAALIWAAVDLEGRRSPVIEAVVSAATLGMTITNWMVGLLVSFIRRPFRSAAQVSANALAIVVLLWVAQKQVFPGSRFFAAGQYLEERSYFLAPEAGGPGRVAWAFVAHPMVMPGIDVVDRPSTGRWPVLSIQESALSSTGGWGRIAIGCWLLLLATGVVAAWRQRRESRLPLLLVGVLLGQLLLHLAFGYETFLYGFHWLPLLIGLAALGTRGGEWGRWRIPMLGLVAVLAVTAGANNLLQFEQARIFERDHAPVVAQRALLDDPSRRPGVPWPTKATALEGPQVRLFDVPAWEPGGGLWPAFDTFNVAFWVVDSTGSIIATSHDTTGHVFESKREFTTDGHSLLRTSSRYYTTTWELVEPRSWKLTLAVPEGAKERIAVMVRGVGWSYSRVTAIEGRDGDYLINKRWRLRANRALPGSLGIEGTNHWFESDSGRAEVESEVGMGFVRIGPLSSGMFEVSVADERRGQSVNTLIRTLSYRKSARSQQ